MKFIQKKYMNFVQNDIQNHTKFTFGMILDVNFV